MAYDPTVNWEDGVTALSAEHMNNLEEGVREALTKSEGNNDMWSYIRNLVYPVGSIYMSATLSTHEAVEAILGGTWEAWGSGRVPVGVDTSDSSFNTAEKTGGEKTHTLTTSEMPQHAHNSQAVGSETGYFISNDDGAYGTPDYQITTSATGRGLSKIRSTAVNGSGSAHNNLQPYITCYMYRRKV